MSHRVLPARDLDLSARLKDTIQPNGRVLPFPAPNFASFAEAERHSAPARHGGGFLLGMGFTFAFEAIAVIVFYGAWHLWKVLQ